LSDDEGRRTVTRLLNDVESNPQAMQRLMDLIYGELRKLARFHLLKEGKGHTLDTQALVHEAYIRMVDAKRLNWDNRGHFFGAVSRAMRRILVNHALAKKAQKRGGGQIAETLDLDRFSLSTDGEETAVTLLEIDEALNRMEQFNPRGCRLVELKFFVGLNHREIADALGLSEVTVRRSWLAAKTWLKKELMTRSRDD